MNPGGGRLRLVKMPQLRHDTAVETDGIEHQLQLLFVQLPAQARLQGFGQVVELAQCANVSAVIAPECRPASQESRAEVQLPQGIEHLLWIQAYFVGFIEPSCSGSLGVETAVQEQ
ncbi:hypothetical protein D3C75_1070290 [compost metagenome]